jgi:hypothetical protein
MYPVERPYSAFAWQSEPSHKRATKLLGRLVGHVEEEEAAADQTAVVAEEAAVVVAEGADDQTAAQTDLEPA